MIRYRRKYFYIWGLLLLFALWAHLRSQLGLDGVDSINLFARDALEFLTGISILVCVFVFTRKIFLFLFSSLNSAQAATDTRTSDTSFRGRVSRCYQCKHKVEQTTVNKCQFCGWIRCNCGACGCGFS